MFSSNCCHFGSQLIALFVQLANRKSITEHMHSHVSEGLTPAEWWDIDLKTFRIDLIPNRKLIPGGRKRFEFVETETGTACCFGAGSSRFPCGSKLERRRDRRGTSPFE